MTLHIKNSIEIIIFGGGFVHKKLDYYINRLGEIRHPKSIKQEFIEAFADIESRKGSIIPLIKTSAFETIDKLYENYPDGERELF